MKTSSTRMIDKIRPTLFIALGGTGMEIAHRVRRRILAHAWGGSDSPVRIEDLKEFPLAQFIYFDVGTAYSYESRRSPASDLVTDLVRFNKNEMLCQTLDMRKYFHADDDLDRYPHIAEWFPVSPPWIREWLDEADERANNHMPTYAPRFFSRLYFFDKYQELCTMIRGKIDTLHYIQNVENAKRLGVDIEPASMRIVVLSSTAGGTGSGAFLDMGYLAKWLAKNEVREGAKVDLCLMLPGGYTGPAKSRCEANTYAALMELETCMGSGNRFVSGWSNSEHPDLPRTPYDDVFLFDTGNLAQETAKTSDLFDMIADILFEDFVPSDSSSRKNSIRVCHTSHSGYKVYPFTPPIDRSKYGAMELSYSKAYSAFGQAIIDTQVEQLKNNIACNPFIKMLEEMSVPERRTLFQNCIETAMPWVEVNLHVWAINSDQYTFIVGVDGARIFEQKFGDEFKNAIPDCARMLARNVMFNESGVPDKLICYVELNGLPLTALTNLPNWRESYYEENLRSPVHIHKDRTLFVHPLAPSAAALDRLAEHFKLFIQGIVLGVLKLRVDDPKERLYCLSNKGKEYSIGNERLIRQEGLPDARLELFRKQVADAHEQLNTTVQYAGLEALYGFYSQAVYPFAISRHIDGFLCDVEGFAHVMCATLCEEARKKLTELTDGDTNDLVSRVAEKLDLWSDEIEGSETDVYENEVDKAHRPKRILKREFFQAGWLEQRIGMVPPEPPPLPEIPVYIAINGKQTGPHNISTLHQMAKLGQLTRDSLVWIQGMANWSAASTVPYIINVLNAVPSLDEGPPQID